jgi:hypothetical protein
MADRTKKLHSTLKNPNAPFPGNRGAVIRTRSIITQGTVEGLMLSALKTLEKLIALFPCHQVVGSKGGRVHKIKGRGKDVQKWSVLAEPENRRGEYGASDTSADREYDFIAYQAP